MDQTCLSTMSHQNLMAIKIEYNDSKSLSLFIIFNNLTFANLWKIAFRNIILVSFEDSFILDVERFSAHKMEFAQFFSYIAII